MEEGWSSVPDKFVCAKCFDDEGIRAFINGAATARRCSYCHRFGRTELAAEMDEVLSFIATCLNREYERPEDGLGRDNESESGWALITPTDTWDLFCDFGFGNGPEELFEDLVGAFSDRQWVQKDPYGSLPCDSLRYTWEAFSRQVKHEMRFMFFKAKTQEDYDHEPEPHEILDSLEQISIELDLIRTKPQGFSIQRARQHESSVVVASVEDIGPPPEERASQSRMSPAGIPMFYGASDAQTAFAEVFENKPARDKVTFGTFVALRPLRLLDLTGLPSPPTIFCEEGAYPTRMPLIFMRNFVTDAMKPIVRDGREHIDYVPTQVVSEYFRHLFRCEDGQPLDGILYPSSKSANETCFTLFCTIDECAESSGLPRDRFRLNKPILKLTHIETKQVQFSPPGYV